MLCLSYLIMHHTDSRVHSKIKSLMDKHVFRSTDVFGIPLS